MRKQIAQALIALALPAAALADITDKTLTIPIGQQINLETGTVVASGGDLKWDGTLLTPQGTARVAGLGAGDAQYTQTTLTILQFAQTSGLLQPGVPYAIGALTNFPLAVALTTAGHLAKIEVTSATTTQGQALPIKFTTYGATGSGGGPSAPTVDPTNVRNNYSELAPGLPNYGIAQGSIFYVKGTNLANTTESETSAAPGLPTNPQNVSVTVAVGATTVQCPIYYISPGQINAVLPSSVSVGTGTVVVTNNGVSSAAAPIVVVPSAFGIIRYNGTLAATYANGPNPFTATNATHPGDTIVVWGTGVGADPKNDDKLFPQNQDNLTNVPMQAYVGGIVANISYRGRSQFPGLDQIVLTIPNGVTPGCWVSLAIVSGSPAIVSNGTTIPIAASGSTCSEPNSVFSPNLIQPFLGNTTVRTGALFIGQTTSIAAGNGTTVSNLIGGTFQSATVTSYTSTIGANSVSTGSCLVTVTLPAGGTSTTTPLDAGPSINVSGPQGSLALPKQSFGGQQIYAATSVAANFVPASGGPFTYDNSAGGTDIGHFNTTTNFPANFTWTNPSAGSVVAIDRTAGVTVTWSGGAPGVTVTINGSASSTTNGQLATGSFTCQAPLSAGTFTVPPPVLLALPAGSGTLSLTDNTTPQIFTASGLDLGYTFDTAAITENVRYN